MAKRTLAENVAQAISDFNSIKTEIESSGIEIPNGTATSEYANLVGEVKNKTHQEAFTEGYVAGYDEGEEDGYNEGYDEGYGIAEVISYWDGHAAGYDVGYAEGKTEGIEQGRQVERDEFWDDFQGCGKRRNYQNAFMGDSNYYWTDKSWKPKYDIIATSGVQMFNRFGGPCDTTNNISYDIAQLLEDRGVILDISKCVNLNNFCYYSNVSRLPTLDLTGLTATMIGLVALSKKLVTIDKLIVKDSIVWQDSFGQAIALKNIVIEGTIGTTFEIHYSPLTPESMVSIITHLKKYSGTDNESKYIVKFSSACWEALEASGNVPESYTTWKNYVEYGLGWLT